MTEIQQANYWEHFKYAKELALFLPETNIKRIEIEETIRQMLQSDQNQERSVATKINSSNDAGIQNYPH